MTKCAFGKVVVNNVAEAQFPFGTDLEGRFLYLAAGERRWLLAAFDFSYMWRTTCLEWRQRISQATGIAVPCIWLHSTQTHSGLTAPQLSGAVCERVADVSLPVIQRMIAAAEEAQMACVIPDLGARFNFRRERYIPELGAVTVWGGQLQFAEGRPPFTQDPAVMLLDDWAPDLPAFDEPIYFDRPVDGQAALLVFRGSSGAVLGSISRFSGHPDVVAAATHWGAQMEHYRYHHDWPGYVRRTIEERLGGVGVCINGPCGDVSVRASWPANYEQADAEARRVGEGVARACLDTWQEHEPAWESVRLGMPTIGVAQLPLRDTMPRSRAELAQPQMRERYEAIVKELDQARAAKAAAAHVKRLIDERQHHFYISHMVEKWVDISDEELQSRVIGAEVQALHLGDVALCGLPGESMTDTSMWLRAQTLGRKLITFDQINGYCSYLTTPEEHAQGGYSYWGGCLAVEAEPRLRQAALEVIQHSRDGA